VKKFSLSLQWKFFLCIVLIVVPTLSVIFTWTGFQNEKQAAEQVVNRARVLARQIILTRQWVTDCGGVMVAGESKGAIICNGAKMLELQAEKAWQIWNS